MQQSKDSRDALKKQKKKKKMNYSSQWQQEQAENNQNQKAMTGWKTPVWYFKGPSNKISHEMIWTRLRKGNFNKET